MLQNPCKTLGFKKNMVYKILPGGSKPCPASGLNGLVLQNSKYFQVDIFILNISLMLANFGPGIWSWIPGVGPAFILSFFQTPRLRCLLE